MRPAIIVIAVPSRNESTLTFELGGQKPIVYQNWKETWATLHFPARGASLRAMGRGEETITRDGEWGLFRLLDEAKVTKESDTEEYLKALWTLDSKQVQIRIDFKPVALLHAFRELDPPRSITAAPSPCAAAGGKRSGGR